MEEPVHKAARLIVPFFSFTLALAVFSNLARAQTQTVLHEFMQTDGEYPYAGVTLDQQGRIYGATSGGGIYGDGVIYRLIQHGQGWVLSPIYSFGSQNHDGSQPLARVVFGPDGLLYGTTSAGGTYGYGTVFSLQPPATTCKTTFCPWHETVLHSFTSTGDGIQPEFGDLAIDRSGNIYGTTLYGGRTNQGVVFKLSRSGSGWMESVLWSFTCQDDGGCKPYSGLIFDSAGNLYGTTNSGGSAGFGTVYELSPTQSGWTETTLYTFTGENGNGAGGLIMDGRGNLYGLTGGAALVRGPLAAYQLTPGNGNWSFSLLNNFGSDLVSTGAAPTFDSQGNLYGPLPNGGSGSSDFGEIFKLTPSGGQWIYSSFYQFDNCTVNGCVPKGTVLFNARGNMYGTAVQGGLNDGGPGVIWQITP